MGPVMHTLGVISLTILLASGARVARDDKDIAAMPTGNVAMPEKVQQALQTLGAPVTLGNKAAKESLVPSMVPPPGLEYRFTVKKWGLQRQWMLQAISEPTATWKHSLAVARLSMEENSFDFGHKSYHVLSNSTGGEEIFKIRDSKHALNPFKSQDSFRILPPGSKDNDDALFTVNGKSGGYSSDTVFTVYRGRQRDGEAVLYAEGQFPSYWIPGQAAGPGGFLIYNDASKTKLLARIEQNPDYGSTDYLSRVNDAKNPFDLFTVTVQPGVDSALVLACSSVFDLARIVAGG